MRKHASALRPHHMQLGVMPLDATICSCCISQCLHALMQQPETIPAARNAAVQLPDTAQKVHENL